MSSEALSGAESGRDEDSDSGASEDSSEAGGESLRLFDISPLEIMMLSDLNQFDPRARRKDGSKMTRPLPPTQKRNARQPRLVELRPQTEGDVFNPGADRNSTFGERRTQFPSAKMSKNKNAVSGTEKGAMEISWIPSTTSKDDDDHSDNENNQTRRSKKQKGAETFGAGMEKGGRIEGEDLEHESRFGRTKRRTGVRSGSKNVFRSQGL